MNNQIANFNKGSLCKGCIHNGDSEMGCDRNLDVTGCSEFCDDRDDGIKEKWKSKKYVYEIYSTKDGIFVERRTVIYINKKYLYYKVPGSYQLGIVNTEEVGNEPNADVMFSLGRMVYSLNEKNIFGSHVFLWFVSEDFKELLEEAREQYVKKILGFSLERCKEDLAKKEEVYLAAKKRYEKTLLEYEEKIKKKE